MAANTEQLMRMLGRGAAPVEGGEKKAKGRAGRVIGATRAEGHDKSTRREISGPSEKREPVLFGAEAGAAPATPRTYVYTSGEAFEGPARAAANLRIPGFLARQLGYPVDVVASHNYDTDPVKGTLTDLPVWNEEGYRAGTLDMPRAHALLSAMPDPAAAQVGAYCRHYGCSQKLIDGMQTVADTSRAGQGVTIYQPTGRNIATNTDGGLGKIGPQIAPGSLPQGATWDPYRGGMIMYRPNAAPVDTLLPPNSSARYIDLINAMNQKAAMYPPNSTPPPLQTLQRKNQ